MKNYILFLTFLSFFFTNCSSDYGMNPSSVDTVYVEKVEIPPIQNYLVGKTTWIEVEYNLPQDTTWWTFCEDGTMYAAWKRKVYVTPFVWQPWIETNMTLKGDYYVYSYDTIRNVFNEIINKNGLTLEQYSKTYSDVSTTWLPIQYEKGGWGLSRLNLMTLTPRTVRPRNGNDLINCTWIETMLFFCFIKWEFGDDNTLKGYQAYEDGKVMNVRDGDPNVIFKKWEGKHLDDITNPIFYQ